MYPNLCEKVKFDNFNQNRHGRSFWKYLRVPEVPGSSQKYPIPTSEKCFSLLLKRKWEFKWEL